MNELIAGYASYASTEAILREQQLASREMESIYLTNSVSITPVTITFTY
ncbi:hypothetical protein [Rhizohabitans arisaemae]|nr:hypothetical protein [Rhizohabitans arisaemae]